MPTMVQIPTSPPMNVADAAAVTTNARTIPLSPSGRPLAAAAIAIAAAIATANVSAVTTSPGGTPVAAIGLNVGGTNPNVTFASLRVGGRKQNSGSSASSQPTTQLILGFSAGLVGGLGATHLGSISTTTQSNSGFSAGLVGKFGATHLDSISTTTNTLGSNNVPRKKDNSLMMPPYSGSIDPSSSTGIAKYINFVKSLYNKWINCLEGNRNHMSVGLAEKAKQYSMAILRVPTSSTGKMARALLTINTISLANVDLGS
jgi:hypothetical protein